MIKFQYWYSPQCIASVLCMLIVNLSPALAATPVEQVGQMVGEYTLISSVNDPAKADWRYKKGWLSVRKLDDQHYLLLHACAWADSPRSQCNEWFILELRGTQLFMMDNSSPVTRIIFDHSTHKLAIVSEGVNGTKRLDIYAPGNFIMTKDVDLARRMKAANKSWDAMKDTKAIKNWTYTSEVMDLTN
jgi:hypothetical protein